MSILTIEEQEALIAHVTSLEAKLAFAEAKHRVDPEVEPYALQDVPKDYKGPRGNMGQPILTYKQVYEQRDAEREIIERNRAAAGMVSVSEAIQMNRKQFGGGK